MQKPLMLVALGFVGGAAAAGLAFVLVDGNSRWRSDAPTAAPPPAVAAPAKPSTPPLGAGALTATQALAQRERRQGHYVLDSEIPWLRDRLDRNTEQALAGIMALVGRDYELLFDRLGLASPLREQLLHHLALIYKEKRQIKILQSSLANAQSDFLARMKAALPADKYAEVLGFEEFDQARRESSQLIEFARTRGMSGLSPERLAEFLEVVHAARAYSPRTQGEWGSALHEPASAVSGERVESYLVNGLREFSENRETLLALARERGFSSEEIGLMSAYYAQQETHFTNGLRDLKDPLGAQVRLLESRIARMKTDPNADRRAIQRAQESLDLLRRNRPSGP